MTPMPRKLRNSLLLCLCLLPLTTWALPTDSQQPMQITSDSSTVDRSNGIATFIGHVQFIQGSTKVTGDKMVVYFDKKNQMQKVVVTGNLAEAWTQPQANKPVLHAKAQTINYLPTQHTIDLEGTAQADQNGNVLQGPSLSYNTLTQVLTTLPSKTGRTTIVIQPQNSNGQSGPATKVLG